MRVGETLLRMLPAHRGRSEEGWRDTAGGQKASDSNCEGWTGMLCAMKARLEYGIILRDGFYK